MAQIQRPDLAELRTTLGPWKLLETSLTPFFADLATENGLEVKLNPAAPYQGPVFLREAIDPQAQVK